MTYWLEELKGHIAKKALCKVIDIRLLDFDQMETYII